MPIRTRHEVVLLPVRQIASIVAEGDLLHVTTLGSERHIVSHQLKDLAARLDPAKFIRLGRGALVSIHAIVKVNLLKGGALIVVLSNGQTLPVSRIQSRVLREQILRL